MEDNKIDKEKLSWKERFMINRILKHGYKGIKRSRKLKQEEKDVMKLEMERQKTITAIMQMGDVFELFQDKACKIPATKEWFEEQDFDFLLDYLEEILDATKVRVNEK